MHLKRLKIISGNLLDVNNMKIIFNGSEADIPDIVDSECIHYFYTLLKAIESVCYAKYVSNAGNHAISDVQGVEIKIGELLERTFAYELYRQWLNLLEDEGSELTVNSEVAKEMSLMTTVDAFHQIMNGTTKYPDLILHKSHNNLKYNTFVCEIKRHEGMIYEDIVLDISKLCAFLSHQIWDDNPYKYGFFIVIRDELDSIKSVLESGRRSNEYVFYTKLKKYEIELFKRIICISYIDDIITYNSLYNVLELMD